MASLVLGTIGNAIGGPIGGFIGSSIGSYIDNAYLIPALTPDVKVQGTRIADLKVMSSNEGANIPAVWGRLRVSTQMIWSTDFREIASTEDTGGKGGGNNTEVTTYTYDVSFALGLCEGVISGVGRIWMDGKVKNLASYNHRVYLGTEDQEPDPKIAAVQGAGATPAFRGLAYIVFEDLPLEEFGNRIPQVTVEVFRSVGDLTLEGMAKGFTVIPGTTEFGYATSAVERRVSLTESASINMNASPTFTDFVVALDDLQAAFPNVEHVSLVVAWHGTDLRVGECEIRPKVEEATKPTRPWRWNVGGLDMADAEEVSRIDDRPAIGGAPADRSVYEALVEIKSRGLKATLYPFIIMDVPADNALPNPYGGSSQPAYPWRGRITCDPAPGEPGSPDKTATAGTQLAAFVGTADPSDFGWNAGDLHVDYDGPDEWTFRRFILHLARLGQEAGLGDGDAFLIGSEMVALTTLRSGASTYPFVAALQNLAADVKGMLGSEVLVSYAADWSEYHSHRPGDGSGDVFFHLDPLWADANVDFIGVDNYLPLSDWRDGVSHLDAEAGWSSIYDLDYLKANVEGGENYAWFYASTEDREDQVRTPITDGAYGKPWVYRNKDFRNWWSNDHYNRPGGVESGSPTGWTPQSKPIIFTEIGCPAVDKGSNQPNVFVDPKSSESFLPYFSSGARDDQIQKAYLIAFLDYFEDPDNNPVSLDYGGPMIDTGRHYIWTWDARPYPEFPAREDLWADAPNWRLGHWLTGRAGYSALGAVVQDIVGPIAAGLGVEVIVADLNVNLSGYMRGATESPRDTLAPLMQCFFFDGYESGGAIRFESRARDPVRTFTANDLVAQEEKDFVLTRRQETEIARTLKFTFLSLDADYQSGSVYSRRLIGDTSVVAGLTANLCLDYPAAQGIADGVLIEAHVKREALAFALPPSQAALDAGDIVQLDLSRTVVAQIEQIGYAPDRAVTAKAHDRGVYDLTVGPLVTRVTPRPTPAAIPFAAFLDLPILRAEDEPNAHNVRLAATGDPWAGTAFLREGSLDTLVTTQGRFGQLDAPLPAGPLWRWDEVNEIVVSVGANVTLASRTELEVLNGANLAAVQTDPDDNAAWELVQFRDAELIDAGQYRLTNLLRGQRGTDAAMVAEIATGARFVLMDATAIPYSQLPASLVGVVQTWRYGPNGQPSTGSTYQDETFAVTGVGRRPFTPVHLEAAWDEDGDIALNWIRRTRINGDTWDVVEVPLGETSESYRVEILAGSPPVAVRTETVTTPSFTYTVADQTTDFGGPVTAFAWRVAQANDSWGVGPFAEQTSEL